MILPQWARTVLRPATRPAAAPDVAGLTEEPRPVTRGRIGAFLRQSDYGFEIDHDGDPTGIWNGNPLWFILLGEDDEVLQVRGRLRPSFTAENKVEVLRVVNDWNQGRIWAKAYVREEEAGLALYAEFSVDLEHGVTDHQLAQQLDCGISTSVMALDSLSESLRPSTSLGDEAPTS